MFHKLRLWAKIMVVMGIAIGGVGAALTFTNLSNMNRLVHDAERSALDAHLKAIHNAIAAESRSAEVLSALVAGMPVVQDKFDGGERKAVADMFVPGFQALARDYGVEQFQFHTPPAVSWLRVHAPQKYGDDLSSFRSTVVAANRTLQPVRGLEGGVAGLGIRGMVPVQRAGRHVGSVEFGMGFAVAAMRGSENNDPYRIDAETGEIEVESNNAGGILGGISTGAPVMWRMAVKPTPSIGREQQTVDMDAMENAELSVHGRHDPCIVPRAVPVAEAAAALAIWDALLEDAAQR